jgi:hypothetical protein
VLKWGGWACSESISSDLRGEDGLFGINLGVSDLRSLKKEKYRGNERKVQK